LHINFKQNIIKVVDKKCNNKSFGIVFFIFFLILSLLPLFKNDQVNFYFLAIAIVFLVLGLLNAKILTPLNKYWVKFGDILGKFVSPIIMLLIYFFTVFPVNLLLRLFNKDVMYLKLHKKNKSYWIKKEVNDSNMNNQF